MPVTRSAALSRTIVCSSDANISTSLAPAPRIAPPNRPPRTVVSTPPELMSLSNMPIRLPRMPDAASLISTRIDSFFSATSDPQCPERRRARRDTDQDAHLPLTDVAPAPAVPVDDRLVEHAHDVRQHHRRPGVARDRVAHDTERAAEGQLDR